MFLLLTWCAVFLFFFFFWRVGSGEVGGGGNAKILLNFELNKLTPCSSYLKLKARNVKKMTKLVLLSHFQWLVTENAINVIHMIAFNLFKKYLNLNLIKNSVFKSLIKKFKILLFFFNNIFLPLFGTQNRRWPPASTTFSLNKIKKHTNPKTKPISHSKKF